MSLMTFREGGTRSTGRRSYRPLSEINVTPLVDVMLVLLIVFMITAPLLTVGVPVDLPKTQSAQIVGEDEPIVVTVNSSGKIYIQEAQVKMRSLAARLSALTKNRRDTRIFVRGDRRIDYGRVMEVMGRINSAGFTRVALITELPTGKNSDGRRR